MKKGLLIGNGMNSRLGINNLSVDDIKGRFQENIIKYSPFFENLYNINISDKIASCIVSASENKGVESLAGSLYKYVKIKYIKNCCNTWSDNNEERLQDLITCIVLLSVFYTNTGKIKTKYDKKRMIDLHDYECIYTLNYAEFWNSEKRCIYLHGRLEVEELENDKNVIFVNKQKMELEEYKKAVEQMREKGSKIVFLDTTDIIVAPSVMKKEQLIKVKGLFPSDKLYPSEDLFPMDEKELYSELEEVEELDLFGVSPYGDKSLIDAINKKTHVKVYVYRKEKNTETEEWERILCCSYELVDAEKI